MQINRSKHLVKSLLITLIVLTSLSPGLVNAGNSNHLIQTTIYCSDDIADSSNEISIRAFDHL